MNVPKKLKYQWQEDLNISDRCCYELKKDIAKKWQEKSKKQITMTGMRAEEGGERTNINCIVTQNDKIVKFHPLVKVTDEWEEWFIQKFNIKLCKLYYPPFSFKRTGCKGCPYSLKLQDQLDAMEKFLPAERKQCEIIWKPVYEEYRRIGYRLRKEENANN